MTSLSTSIVEEVGLMFMDLQTELVFFCLAIGTHLLFSSKLSLKAVKPKVVEGSAPGVHNSPSKKQQLKAPSGDLSAFKTALRAGDIESAFTHFEAIQCLWKEQDSPSNAPQMLMEQLVKLAGQSGKLAELLQILVKLGLVAKALDLILLEGANRKDAAIVREAECIGREHGVQFTAVIYQALIKSAGACGNLSRAKQFMKEAQSSGIADVATHTAYIKEVLKSGSSQEARKALESLKTSRMQLTTTTFNGLLSVAVSSNGALAWTVFEDMKAFNVKPDHVTCSILLKSISPTCKVNLERIMSILEGLSGETDEVLIGSIVEACLRVGRADILISFLKKQQNVAIKGAHTYGSIIRAYGYVHDIEGAWAAWNDMRRKHIVPISVTLGCMVEALVTNGDLEGGYDLIQKMREDEKTAPLVNAVIYGSLIKGFSHKRCFNRVWEVYDEMVAQNLKFSMVTFNTLIDACSRSGELGRIPSLLKDIDEQGLKLGIVTYGAIIKGYCAQNRLDEAFQLLEDMRKTTELEPDEVMYNTLLDGCARRGLVDRGMQVFEKMQASGVRPSNFTLSVLVKMANRGRKLDKAFQLCEDISSQYGFRLNVHVFDNLVQACINHNDLPRAIGVLERMLKERVRPDVRSYSLILRACLETRQGVDAAGILRAATGLSESHPRLSKSGAIAQPQGGLPADLVSEVLAGLIDRCGEERLAAGLFVDLGRCSPGLRLDSKLRLRLAARMTDL